MGGLGLGELDSSDLLGLVLGELVGSDLFGLGLLLECELELAGGLGLSFSGLLGSELVGDLLGLGLGELDSSDLLGLGLGELVGSDLFGLGLLLECELELGNIVDVRSEAKGESGLCGVAVGVPFHDVSGSDLLVLRSGFAVVVRTVFEFEEIVRCAIVSRHAFDVKLADCGNRTVRQDLNLRVLVVSVTVAGCDAHTVRVLVAILVDDGNITEKRGKRKKEWT